MPMRQLKDEIKNKLKAPSDSASATAEPDTVADTSTSRHFPTPMWERFYKLECELNNELASIEPSNITHIYNPIRYASEVHCAYLRKYLKGPKKLMFVGMNPGPNGMAQNGVPFGNTKTVRHLMKLEGQVEQPPSTHPKRSVTGLSCTTEESSGIRIWSLINELAGNLDIFSQQCFMHNFCPLAFFDSAGKNITPSELKGETKAQIRDICLKFLDKEIQLIQPEVVVSIGSYVADCVKRLKKQQNYSGSDIKFLQLAHPSPRSVNNTNWSEKASQFLEDNNLIHYLRNEN